MKISILKAFIFLLFLFFLDLLKPFGYSLPTEFLFLGIVYLSLNCDLKRLLILSVIFGYINDTFGQAAVSLRTLEYVVVSLLAYNLRINFMLIDRKSENFLIMVAIAFALFFIHIIFSSFMMKLFLPLFILHYLIQSTLIYLFLVWILKDRILNRYNLNNVCSL